MTMPVESAITHPGAHTAAPTARLAVRPALGPALRLLLVLTLLTGLVYPALVTLGAMVFFPDQALGSLVRVDGQVVGSALLGQANEMIE